MVLDHLERGNAALQPLLLSLLADLLKRSDLAHTCVLDWLSERTQATAPELLLRLWRTAEADWGVCTDGVLTSTQRPLAGSGKRSLWVPQHEVRLFRLCSSLCCTGCITLKL